MASGQFIVVRGRLYHWDSSITSTPEMVALFMIGSKVRFSFPWAIGFKWWKVLVTSWRLFASLRVSKPSSRVSPLHMT